jgi:transposase
MVAEVIDRLDGRPPGTGRPPLPTLKVVEALRFFVREGVQWRELRATAGRASGATLRRRLGEWAGTALLRRVHLALIRMVRAGPEPARWDVVVDSCSVRAKRGGALTGPNPTDRGKPGTKYHVVVATDGLPLGAVPSAANVHDTRLFRHLLRLAQVACAAIGKLYADAGYDSAENRDLCRHDGIQPHISARSAKHTARGWAESAASSSTTVPGSWPTSGSIGDTTGLATSSAPCWPLPASSSPPTAWTRSENRALSSTA